MMSPSTVISGNTHDEPVTISQLPSVLTGLTIHGSAPASDITLSAYDRVSGTLLARVKLDTTENNSSMSATLPAEGVHADSGIKIEMTDGNDQLTGNYLVYYTLA
jgi:hypothetical protein